MTVTQRAIVAGIALVAADLTPAQIASAHLAINPAAELWQDPRVAWLLADHDEWRRRAAQAELRLKQAGWPRISPDWAFLDRARIAMAGWNASCSPPTSPTPSPPRSTRWIARSRPPS